MLQIRSSLDVADNSGAKIVWNIGVLGKNQRYAGIGDVIKVHVKVAAPDGTVKKGEVHDAVVVRSRQKFSKDFMKFHVKKGDEVVVLAGKEKGKRGKIIAVNSTKQRVIIEGVQMIKRHTPKSQQHPQGAIVEREGSVHVSNVM